MGRKPIEIDWTQFEKLCAIQCTREEIAAWFNCSIDTIERSVKKKYKETFAAVFAQKRRNGHISLRRKQFETAMSGDKTMLIWLGKQYLGQSDKTEIKDERPRNYVPPASMVDDETQKTD